MNTPDTNYCDSMTPDERANEPKIVVTTASANTPDTERKCEECFGTGKIICSNPDHGILDALSFRGANESRCPVCGHDEEHKTKDDCPHCLGTGNTTPDTDWEKELKAIVKDSATDNPFTIAKVINFTQNLISSRDTYWKERVREDYQAIKETPAYVNLMTQWGQLDEDGVCIAVSRQALEETTQALDTLLNNLK